GVRKMRLKTNNPTKRVGLQGYGLEIVEQVPIETDVYPESERYMLTKRDKMGHQLERIDPHKPNHFLESLGSKENPDK
ncbi:MAG: bifunctional 3,4-dihydroxy-2-butanone-4-phosphate synthase/GTP cyclohydrolase II, partial [Cyclonatronaceae bacterium]